MDPVFLLLPDPAAAHSRPTADLLLVALSDYLLTDACLQRRRRPPIDRSQIGLPTNFQHTAHVGSTDVTMGASHLTRLQNHMQSKGGYDTAVPVDVGPS